MHEYVLGATCGDGEVGWRGDADLDRAAGSDTSGWRSGRTIGARSTTGNLRLGLCTLCASSAQRVHTNYSLQLCPRGCKNLLEPLSPRECARASRIGRCTSCSPHRGSRQKDDCTQEKVATVASVVRNSDHKDLFPLCGGKVYQKYARSFP